MPALPRSPIFIGELPGCCGRLDASAPSCTPLTKTRRVPPSQEPATCVQTLAGMLVAPVTLTPKLQSSRVPNMILSVAVTRSTYPPMPLQSYFSTIECCTPTTERLIHASTVIGPTIAVVALLGTRTNWLVPLNARAKFVGGGGGGGMAGPLVFAMNTVALLEAPSTVPAGAPRGRITVKVGLTSASGIGVTT